MDQQPTHNTPFRCRPCVLIFRPSPNPTIDVVRLRKSLSYDNDVFRCARCGLLFSPPTLSHLSVRPEVEGHAPQLRRETKKPKLNSYERETNETASAPEKKCASYGIGRPSAPRFVPNRPPNCFSQIRRETAKSKLNSYARETDETGNSYEKQTFSYDRCLTPICKSPQTRPQNHASQLRRETAKSKLNSYARETSEIRPSFHTSEVTR